VPEPEVCGDPTTEIRKQRLPVGALRGRRQPEEDLGMEVTHDPLVRVRGRVVTFVENDKAEVFGTHAVCEPVGGRLHHGEDVFPPFRRFSISEQLTESGIRQHVPERRSRLFEQLAPMREEKKARHRTGALGVACVVEGRDDSLSRARRRNHQVSIAEMQGPLGCESIEDLLLKGEWTKGKELRNRGRARGTLRSERLAQPSPVGVRVWIVRFELTVVPEAFKRSAELVDDVREIGRACFDHPLLTGSERGRREVRGSHFGRAREHRREDT
jgi:hypothetical protein